MKRKAQKLAVTDAQNTREGGRHGRFSVDPRLPNTLTVQVWVGKRESKDVWQDVGYVSADDIQDAAAYFRSLPR